MKNFFRTLSDHHQDDKPFAVYSRPNDGSVLAMLQQDDQLYFTKDFDQGGFVFSPFDSSRDAILIHPDQVLHADHQPNSEAIVGSVEYSSKGKDAHMALVSKAIKSIEDDKFKKVVVSRLEETTTQKDALALFRSLLDQYTQAFVYLFFHPKVGTWLGATPETLVKIQDDGFETMALAGTIPIDTETTIDWKNKELEEQLYVTDAIVSALSDIADLDIGKVQTVKAGQLLHLQTIIKGRLSGNTPLNGLVQRLHPTPAVCGLPTAAAKDFIANHESYDREFYTGFLGALYPDEGSELFVNLRCMKLSGQKVSIYVGGGVTAASDPEAEWEETVNKTGTIKRIL